MKKIGIIGKDNFWLINIFVYIILIIVKQLLFQKQIEYLWINALFIILDNILLFLLIIINKEQLHASNITGLSLLLLVLFRNGQIDPNYSIVLRNFFIAFNFIILVIFSIFIIKSKDKNIERISIKQAGLLIAGLVIGICIALFKIKINHSDLLTIALTNPFKYLNSIVLSFSVLGEELFFRGLLWGYLRKKGVNEYLVIMITSLVWVFSHINIYSNNPEMINFLVFGIFLGIIFGFLVKFTKSVDISIGAHVGNNSFLTMQLVFFS